MGIKTDRDFMDILEEFQVSHSKICFCKFQAGWFYHSISFMGKIEFRDS